MRIQQMDRILKESRYARRGGTAREERGGFVQRVWGMLTSVFHRGSR